MEVNLFELYKKNEDRQTHAFLALLNLIKKYNFDIFMDLCFQLGILPHKDFSNKNVKIKCLPSKFNDSKGEEFNITWDGQISFRDKVIVAIESKVNRSALNQTQLKRHLDNLKRIDYPFKKLILLTPFGKEWLRNKYQFLQSSYVEFLSWREIYDKINHLLQKNDNKDIFHYVIDEYLHYVQYINREYGGIIQTLNQEILDNLLDQVKAGKASKFHMPKQMIGFDVPGNKIFLFDKEKGGVFASFVSEGIYWNPKRKGVYEGKYEYYFKIKNYKEFKPVKQEIIIQSLNNKSLDKWKNRGQPYFKLSTNMVEIMDSLIENEQ